MPRVPVKGSIVGGAEFGEWLRRHDLTDANAGRLFGVSAATCGVWIREGLPGPAAMLFKLMENQGLSPFVAAGMVGVAFSGFPRSCYGDRSGYSSRMHAGQKNAPTASGAAMGGIPAGADRAGYQWEPKEGGAQ